MSSSFPEGFFYKGSDEIYRCAALQQLPWLEHGFTTRKSAAAISGLITLRQVHSAQVLNACGLEDRSTEGDALVSDEISRPIGVRTADCVPLLLADSRTRAVAAVHAGWRGTAAFIVRKVVAKMTEDFGARPKDIFAAIGPAISQCCYEVGPEVANRFESLFPEWAAEKQSDRPRMVDLIDANQRVLVSAGVPAEQIFLSGLCTSCTLEDFYSYRREPENPGRMISFIMRAV